MSETYRLPDGSTTTSSDKYLAAWRGLAEPIERLLGWKLCAFDPDVAFRTEGGRGSVVDASVPIAQLVQRLDIENADAQATPADLMAQIRDLEAFIAHVKEWRETPISSPRDMAKADLLLKAHYMKFDGQELPPWAVKALERYEEQKGAVK